MLDNNTYSSSNFRTSLLSSYSTIYEQDCTLWNFRLGHPNFKYMKYLFPRFILKLMSPLYPVTCAFKPNNIEYPSLHNHINPHNHLPLSIVTFGVHPRSLPLLRNGGYDFH